MTQDSYTRRKIKVSILIGKGPNGEGGFDTYTLPDRTRISASITKAGGMMLGEATLRIYGISNDLMHKVSSLGLSNIRTRDNKIAISAGDDRYGMALVFQGNINEAWQDFSGSPETFLSVSAYDGLIESLRPIPATSYRGSVPYSTIIADLATRLNWSFENKGVVGVTSNPYYPGTGWTQMQACAEDGHFEMIRDLNKVVIWPKGTSRGGTVALVNKDTGLVGYPSVGGQNYIRITTLFLPSIAYGSDVKVESLIKPANGVWTVNTLSHNLECETPNGAWFTTFEGRPPGVAATPQ